MAYLSVMNYKVTFSIVKARLYIGIVERVLHTFYIMMQLYFTL